MGEFVDFNHLSNKNVQFVDSIAPISSDPEAGEPEEEVAEAEAEEDELEDEEDEDEEEEEVSYKPKKKVKKEQPSAPSEPAPEVKPLPRPASREDAFIFFKNKRLISVLRRNKLEVKDDGSDINEKMNEVAKVNPSAAYEFREWADKKAKEDTDGYTIEHINPYQQQQRDFRVANAITLVKKEFPDIIQYQPQMDKLAKKFFERNPELLEYPEIALPMLLMKAKAGTKGKSVVGGKRRPPRMETDGSRLSVGGNKPKKNAEEPAFTGRPKDPLAGIFQ